MKVYDLPSIYASHVNNLRAILETQANKGIDYRPFIYDITSTEKLEDKDVEIGGVEGLEEWEEKKAALETSFEEGWATEYKMVEYGRELPIGRWAQKFFMYDYDKLQTAASMLGKKAYRSVQSKAFEVLTKGATDATFVHGRNDGKRVFSILHPNSPSDSTAWSNMLTNSTVPGYDGVMYCVEKLVDMTDDKGDWLDLGSEGYTIITGNFQDYLGFQEVVHPSATEKPGTANREINVFNGSVKGLDRPIKVVYIPFAKVDGYDNAYWVVANEGEGSKPFQLLEATPLSTEEYDDPKTKTKFVRVSTMFDRKLKYPRHIIMSLGDGSTTVNW